MAKMLAFVCNEHQSDLGIHVPHIGYANNNSVSTIRGVVPSEVHIGRLLCRPLTVFYYSYVVLIKALTATS